MAAPSSTPSQFRELSFVQLNMHRAHADSAILHTKVASNPSLCLLTEPCTVEGKVTQVPLNHMCVPSATLTDRPRAAIFIPRDIPFVALEQLSNPDCAVALLQTELGHILIASVYLDGNETVVPTWLDRLATLSHNSMDPPLMNVGYYLRSSFSQITFMSRTEGMHLRNMLSDKGITLNHTLTSRFPSILPPYIIGGFMMDPSTGHTIIPLLVFTGGNQQKTND